MARILIIEDNKENSDLMSYLLINHGHTVLTARDGEQGLLLCFNETIDIILCDIQLPKIDGYEIIRRLKSKSSTLNEIPIIAITAYAMVGDKEKILLTGCNGYIAKPIQPEEFVPQIESYLKIDRSINNAYLPYANASHNSAKETDSKTRGTILVVDDNPTDRYLSEILLRSIGFRIILAANVIQAVEKLDQEVPDLIISDYHLPDQNGLEFATMLKDSPAYRNIPFIMISSSLPQETKKDILTSSIHLEEVIFRPIEPPLFLEMIEKIWNKATHSKNISLL